jgi:hypothetical protein
MFKYMYPCYFLMGESLSGEMLSDYQSLTLRIKELEERIAELEKENAEKTKMPPFVELKHSALSVPQNSQFL